MYAGFHYSHSLVDGFTVGHKVAHQMSGRYFRPVEAKNENALNPASLHYCLAIQQEKPGLCWRILAKFCLCAGYDGFTVSSTG